MTRFLCVFLWVSFLNIITVVLKSGLLGTVLALPPPNLPIPSESYPAVLAEGGGPLRLEMCVHIKKLWVFVAILRSATTGPSLYYLFFPTIGMLFYTNSAIPVALVSLTYILKLKHFLCLISTKRVL